MVNLENASEIVNKLLKTIPSLSNEKTQNSVDSKWDKILCSVKGCGKNLAAHSHISDIKNNSLIIETDHPGYIQLFQINRNYILEGVKRAFPKLEIRSMSFVLSKNNASTNGLHESSSLKEISRSEFEKSIDERTKNVEAYSSIYEKNENSDVSTNKKNEIPTEIKNIFENMKEILLTKK